MAARDFEGDAEQIMQAFARRTGIEPGGEVKRYLWTDAYAVRNFLKLFRRTGRERYAGLASILIEQVHHVLGRHRPDDPRQGWISGLPEEAGVLHPTSGGLRIGKPLPERRPDEDFDEQLEWDRDGQYFHYLTKWMAALSDASSTLAEPRYGRNAIELAKSVLPKFLRISASGAPIGVIWKMSIDLSRPLIPASNPHDALDGYLTYRNLSQLSHSDELKSELSTLQGLAAGVRPGTSDALGIGGLLEDSSRLSNLAKPSSFDQELSAKMIEAAARGLRALLLEGALKQPASRRLAFRELGLVIGLNEIEEDHRAQLDRSETGPQPEASIAFIEEIRPVRQHILDFWSDPGNRRAGNWGDHQDINDVMLASAFL